MPHRSPQAELLELLLDRGLRPEWRDHYESSEDDRKDARAATYAAYGTLWGANKLIQTTVGNQCEWLALPYDYDRE